MDASARRNLKGKQNTQFPNHNAPTRTYVWLCAWHLEREAGQPSL